ncbi:ATP-binding protein [Bdellovibrionota bacterium FG-1]
MTATLADYLEVWGFEADFSLFSDSSLGFGLELHPLDVSCWHNERINGLSERLAQFLNALPAGVDCQFVQEIRAGNAELIEAHKKLAEGSGSAAGMAICEGRIEKIRRLDSEGRVPYHGLKLYVRRPADNALLSKPTFLSAPKKFQVQAQTRLERDLEAARRLRETIEQGLRALGIQTRPLTPDEIYHELYRSWNPTRAIDAPQYDPEDVRSSVMLSDVEISEVGFSIAGSHHRVISLKMLPDQTFGAMAAALRELPFDSRLHLSIHLPNQTKEIESLQMQRRLAYSMARRKKSGVSDLDSEAKFQDLETLLEQMIATGEKVFHVSTNVILRSTSIRELEDQVAETLRVLRDLGGAEGLVESIAAFPIFSALSIPNARAKERAKRVKTSNLCDLLPVYGPWRGYSKPSILLRTRQGSLFSFDPFAPELASSNQLVSGGAGSGKSFLTNILLLQILNENPKIYFVDIGGSYKKLCENLKGQYLPLGVGAGLAFNPFDLAEGESHPSPQKIKFLVGLIELMTKDDELARLPKLERAEIEDAIARLYKTNANPRLSHLRAALLEHTEPEIRKYGRILGPWCGETPFGQFVDRDTNIALHRPIVAFDLKGMESYPDLQAVCLYIITDFVWREIQKDRSQMKFLVFDECWKLLKNDAGLAFIEEVFRTFRKYNASAIAISQDIDDFAKSKIAGAILPNCAIKWVLMQQSSDPIRIKDALDLNENEMGLIKSLKQDRGLYSEAFLIAQKERIVAVIESTPLEYWIATTDPKDLGKIEDESRNEPDTDPVEILKRLAEKYPRGVATSNQAETR